MSSANPTNPTAPTNIHSDVHLERWNEFSQLIEWFSDSLKEDDGRDPAITRRQTARLMLKALNTFAERMFLFFEQGFAGDPPRLEQRNMTTEYVYGLLSEQVSYDVDAILRGYTQRRLVSTATDDTTINVVTQRVRLGVAEIDKLAYDILAAAMKAGIVTRPATVFTYFHKSLRIRLLPYVRVAFIGVPYNALRIPEADAAASYPNELLAVAHEVGHYVYRSSIEGEVEYKNALQTLREDLDVNQPWYAPWLEEIAADVFGCIIAGPHIAADFQKLALQKRRNLLGEDDGRHPPPALRPYIYIDTLDALATAWGKDFSSVTEGLTTKWEDSLGKENRLGKEDRLKYTDIRLPGIAAIYSIAEARERVKTEVIAPLLGKFCPLVNLLASNSNPKRLFQALWGDGEDWQNWGNPSTAVAQVSRNADLAAAFANATPPPDLEWVEDQQAIKVQSSTDGTQLKTDDPVLKLGKTSTKFDGQIEEIEGSSQKNKAESVWVEILSFGGWIDQGPSGGVAHGPP